MIDISSLPRIQGSVAGKTLFIRVDFNIELIAGKLSPFGLFKVRAAVPLLQKLLQKGARIVVASDLGHPHGPTPDLSLKPFVKVLRELLGQECVLGSVDAYIRGEYASTPCVLLENLRFSPEEEKGDKAWAKALAKQCDVYINEAFADSHRSHASLVRIPQHIPSYVGPRFVEEVQALNKVMSPRFTRKLLIMGGKKISSKMGYIRNLASIFDTILIGGALANNFTKSQGFDIKHSFYEPEYMKDAARLMRALKDTIVLPQDVVWDKAGETIVDIGPKTVTDFVARLQGVHVVVWNGPLGIFEEKRSLSSAKRIGDALVKQPKTYTVVGGGETNMNLDQLGLLHEFSYASTAGGAMLHYLAHGELPALKYIQKNT